MAWDGWTTAHYDKPHTLYRVFDSGDYLLYVGITTSLQSRLQRHKRHKPWWGRVARIELEEHPDKKSAVLAELDCIDREAPHYNQMRFTR